MILVVDDDRDICTMLGGLLEVYGYEARAVPGGEVVEAARRQRPDLILLDLMMPAPTGWDIYRDLRADPLTRAVPVVVLTALGRTSAITPDLPGAVRLDKPFNVQELLAIVRTHAGPPKGEEDDGD